jgi:hypothetical protein
MSIAVEHGRFQLTANQIREARASATADRVNRGAHLLAHETRALTEQLLQIRVALGQSQSELLRRSRFDEAMDYCRISEFELGTTEPHLSVLLQYSPVAGVHMEDIVDLPEKLPGNVSYRGITRKSASRKSLR